MPRTLFTLVCLVFTALLYAEDSPELPDGAGPYSLGIAKDDDAIPASCRESTEDVCFTEKDGIEYQIAFKDDKVWLVSATGSGNGADALSALSERYGRPHWTDHETLGQFMVKYEYVWQATEPAPPRTLAILWHVGVDIYGRRLPDKYTIRINKLTIIPLGK